jgi:hypothetical protein
LYNSDENDRGLHGRTGSIRAVPYTGDNPLIRHGLLRMSSGARNVMHADGTPFMMVGDTPWALPWRATVETATIYAQDRQAKGFNTALLMSVMPDMGARGPRDRTQLGGFGVGFEDLQDGHLNRLNPEYFQYKDQLISILIDHGIVPVYNPVFQGYGWKGQRSLGSRAVPAEYARYTRYLVARYGARPTMWLVSADGDGLHPPVYAAGREVEAWDAYRQPTGIHYSPHDDWASEGRLRREPDYQFHYNRSHHTAKWLDFQWPQTGHNGEHLPHKVSRAHDYIPTKAVANGEPTYEQMGTPDNAVGWWQGHEAWLNVTSGGTMAVTPSPSVLPGERLLPRPEFKRNHDQQRIKPPRVPQAPLAHAASALLLGHRDGGGGGEGGPEPGSPERPGAHVRQPLLESPRLLR